MEARTAKALEVRLPTSSVDKLERFKDKNDINMGLKLLNLHTELWYQRGSNDSADTFSDYQDLETKVSFRKAQIIKACFQTTKTVRDSAKQSK